MARQSHIQFSIPEPCSVPWNGMTPVEPNQRHCSSCEKVITDFSKFSDDELVYYFKHHQEKTCGRFANDQLGRRMKLLPEKNKKVGWWKMILFIPLSFFSKNSKAQISSVNDSSTSHDTLLIENKLAEINSDTITVVDTNGMVSIDHVDSISTTIQDLPVLQTDSGLNQHSTPEVIYVIQESEISSGCISTTLGFCSMPLKPFFPTVSLWNIIGFFKKTPKPNEAQLDKPDNFKQLTDQPIKKPEPIQPALPASNEITGILPDERKKPWNT